MFQVRLTNRSEKDLKKLDKRFLPKVTQILNLLKNNPLLGEKMSGEYLGFYRVKIPPLRIIYSADMENKIIWIRAIKQRQGAYK